MRHNFFVILGFLIAPAVPALLATSGVFICDSYWGGGHSTDLLGERGITSFISYFVLSFGWCFAIAVVLGGPGYLLLKYFRKLNYITCAIGGSCISAAFPLLAWTDGGGAILPYIGIAAFTGCAGFLAGLVFFRIAGEQRP